MKIFDWVQGKLNGKSPGKKKDNSILATNYMRQEPCKEEFSDWPHGLLAIGTFGNNDMNKELSKPNLRGKNSSSQDQLQDLAPEEVEKLHSELKSMLQKQEASASSSTVELETQGLPFDEFFDCPSRLIDYQTDSNDMFAEDDESTNGKDDLLQRSTSVVISRGKDVFLDKTKSAAISSKRSLSFLLKKMFICRGGFAPTPPFRDPIQKTRMEKILRAILQKKIHPQSSSPTVSKKRCLENKHNTNSEDEDDQINDKAKNGSKWVKTDSEYIVLEI